MTNSTVVTILNQEMAFYVAKTDKGCDSNFDFTGAVIESGERLLLGLCTSTWVFHHTQNGQLADHEDFHYLLD